MTAYSNILTKLQCSCKQEFWGAKFPKMWDSLHRTPVRLCIIRCYSLYPSVVSIGAVGGRQWVAVAARWRQRLTRRIADLQKNGLHAFGYNSFESEPISMKFGTLWAECWRLTQANCVRDRPVSTVWEATEFLFLFFCEVNNARCQQCPVGQILQQLNTATSIGKAVKTFGTEFWKFNHKGSFSN